MVLFHASNSASLVCGMGKKGFCDLCVFLSEKGLFEWLFSVNMALLSVLVVSKYG